MNIPAVTAQQMAEVDRLMTDVFQISLIQMMENAGRNLADCAQQLVKRTTHQKFLILCGSGNNAGGGMVAARHLLNRGFQVDIVLVTGEDRLKKIPSHQWQILKRMGLQANKDPQVESYDLIIDAMIGYGLQGAPRGNFVHWIEVINAAQVPILALDIPSGMAATSGIAFDPCTQAQATLTLALPKTGLIKPEAKANVGTLYLADISVPEQLYASMGLMVGPIFKDNAIIRVA